MQMRSFRRLFVSFIAAFAVTSAVAQAASTPDGLIKQVSTDVIDTVKADKAVQAGDVGRIISLVDAKVMPHVDFNRMAASAVGRPWRNATPEQKKRLEEEFKTLIVRTYAGAISQVKDQTVQLKPMRSAPTDNEVVVRTEVRGRGEPIQLDYRLSKQGDAWKVYDVNVMGVWMVEQYRSMFAQEIQAGGLDGLIARLTEKNKAGGTTNASGKS